jgi:hypothetical protein
MADTQVTDKEIDRRLGVLMKLYEINYDYQNQKEQRLWLLFSAYITILLAAVGWVVSSQNLVNSPWNLVVVMSVLLFFTLFAMVYIAHQNWLKAWSVERDYRMLKKIRLFDTDRKPTYDEILIAAYPPRGDPIDRQKSRIFAEHGLSGVIIIVLLGIIALAQISLILIILGRNLCYFSWSIWP